MKCLIVDGTLQLVNNDCFFSRVEGCIPVCPLNMLLDEITQRCVYFEDCMFENILCMIFSLLMSEVMFLSIFQIRVFKFVLL